MQKPTLMIKLSMADGYVIVDMLRRMKLLMLLITVVKIGNVDAIMVPVVVVVDICVTLSGVRPIVFFDAKSHFCSRTKGPIRRVKPTV